MDASTVSSKPTTLSCVGTAIPSCLAASRTPMAEMSLPAKMAVGRLRGFSSSVPALRPCSNVYASRSTAEESTVIPASDIAAAQP